MLGTWQFGHFFTLGKMTFWTYCHHGHNIFWAFYHPGHFVILGLNVIWAFWLWAICHTWAFCHLGHFNIQSNYKCEINAWFFSTQIAWAQLRTHAKSGRIKYCWTFGMTICQSENGDVDEKIVQLITFMLCLVVPTSNHLLINQKSINHIHIVISLKI